MHGIIDGMYKIPSKNTVRKMCQFAAPPGYRRASAPVSPTLAPFVVIIDAILEADKQVRMKRTHTVGGCVCRHAIKRCTTRGMWLA